MNKTNCKPENVQSWMSKKSELDNRVVYNRDEMEKWLADAEALHGYFSPSDKEARNVEFKEDEIEPEWFRENRREVQQIERERVDAQEVLSELQISENAENQLRILRETEEQLRILRNMYKSPKD